MEIGNMFGFGIGGGLTLAAVIIISSRVFTSKKSVKQIKDELIHSFKQEETQKKIESLEQEQVKIEAKIKEAEKISVEQQEAIRDIVDKSSEVIQEILQEKNPSEIKRKFYNAFNKI